MQEEMKCPTCGGDKFKFLGGNSFKCAYCGATFTNESQASEVQKEVVTRVEYVQAPPQPQYQVPPQQSYTSSGGKSKGTAVVLALLLGGIGAHKFYLGKGGQGVLYLLFVWTFIPSFLALIDLIMLLCMSEREFDQKYNY